MRAQWNGSLRILLLTLMPLHQAGAQGYLLFGNVDPQLAPVTISSVPGTYNPLDGPAGAYVGSNYTASLFYLNGLVADQAEFDARNPILVPSADTLFYGMTGTGPTHGANGDGSGFFDAERPVFVDTTGSEVTVQVRAWYNGGGLYHSYVEALAAGHNVGESAPVRLFLTYPPGPIPDLRGLQPFTVGIPEPSAFALAVVGPAVLILLRRLRSARSRNAP
jgi:hypothetical protein